MPLERTWSQYLHTAILWKTHTLSEPFLSSGLRDWWTVSFQGALQQSYWKKEQGGAAPTSAQVPALAQR